MMSDAEQVGDRRVGRSHRVADTAMRLFELGVKGFDVCEQIAGELVADVFHGRVGDDVREESLGVRSVEFFGYSAC